MFRPTRHTLRTAVAALIAVVLAAPALSQSSSPSARKGFIWSVQRNGHTGWLVGSLHLLTADAYPLPGSMTKAFGEADTLVEETDIDETASPEFMAAMVAKAMYTNGETLQKNVSKETYKLIADRVAKAGLPLEAVQAMKPWMIALTLSALEMVKGGFDPALGLDKHFRDEAKSAGKKFRGLESALEQIGYLEGLGAELQDSLVRETLEGAETELTQVRRIADAWRAGDAATVERLLVSDMKDAPGIYRSLIVDRNRRWMPKIRDCFDTTRCFVVVGAAHLVGSDGLISLLRREGYRVEQQ